MITVELKQVRLFAYHGLFPEERKTGNEFEISLFVSYEEGDKIIQSIQHSINYADLFELLKQEFNTPVDLLETLVIQTAACIKKEYPIVKKIKMTVDKLHPPISGFKGTVGVSYEKEY